MKNFRLTILFVALAIFSSNAQTNFHKLKSAIERSPLVVEGKIVRQSCFEDENSGKIYTKNYLLPKTVFKGASSRDTVIFLTRGGKVGDIISTVSHTVQVSLNQEGIFLLHQSRAIPNQNEISSFIEHLAYDREFEAYFEGGLEKYPSWRLMHEEVGRVCGKDVMIKRISSQELTVLDIPEFCVKLANPILDAINKKVTFDVKAKSNIAGLEFARADIPLKYPKELLGSNVVLNGKVEAVKAESTNTSFYDLNIHDIVDDKFMLTLSSSCNGGESGFVLGTEFEKIAKVTVEVQEYGDLGTINAESFDVDGFAKYFLDGSCQEFIEKCVEGQIPLAMCSISTVSTKPFAAGIGQIITFTGAGFGSAVDGKMKIPNADGSWGNKITVDGTDTKFFDSWQDDKIVVKLLSRTSPSDGPKWPMGSGLWDIVTTTNFCSQMIDIEYAVKTATRPSDGKDLMLGMGFLGNTTNPNPTGTYQWYLYDNVPTQLATMGISISDIQEVVNKAYCNWEAVSGLDIEYKGLISDTINPPGHKNTVGFTSAVANNKLAETGVSMYNCEAGSSFFSGRIYRTDIALNSNLKWYVSLDTLVPDTSYADLFSTLVHEIGHALLLKHSMDTIPNGENDDRIMYPFKSKSKIRRTIDSKTEKGLKLILDRSEAMQAPGECFQYLLLDRDPQIFCAPTAIKQTNINECKYLLNNQLFAGERIELRFDDYFDHQAKLLSVSGVPIIATTGKGTLVLPTYNTMKGLYFLQFTCNNRMIIEKIILN